MTITARSSAVRVWDAGYFGDALKFDGVDDYVDCGTDESLAGCRLRDDRRLGQDPSATVSDRKIASNQNELTGGYKLGIYAATRSNSRFAPPPTPRSSTAPSRAE